MAKMLHSLHNFLYLHVCVNLIFYLQNIDIFIYSVYYVHLWHFIAAVFIGTCIWSLVICQSVLLLGKDDDYANSWIYIMI